MKRGTSGKMITKRLKEGKDEEYNDTNYVFSSY